MGYGGEIVLVWCGDTGTVIGRWYVLVYFTCIQFIYSSTTYIRIQVLRLNYYR